LCDNAEQQCPVTSFHTIKLHLPLAYPAKIKGTEEELQAELLEARDKVKQRIEFVIDLLAQ
jgi:arsenate reductase